jgi:hypothetical protein
MGYTKEGSMDIWRAWDAVVFIYGYKWWGRCGTLVWFILLKFSTPGSCWKGASYIRCNFPRHMFRDH